MPMMYGFGPQRRQMLDAELKRLIDEMPQLGMTSMFIVGPFAHGEVGPGTALDLVVVQETDEAVHRRADLISIFTPAMSSRIHPGAIRFCMTLRTMVKGSTDRHYG